MHIWQNSKQKTSFKLFSLQQKHMLQEAVSSYFELAKL